MSDIPPSSADRTPPPVHESTSAGVALARRLGGRAVDLFAISFVIVVGLSIGRQLMEWWQTEPAAFSPGISSLAATDLDWDQTPVLMKFGNASMTLERVPFHGTRRQLEDELTRLGKDLVSRIAAPTSVPDEAEAEWLRDLSQAPPVLWDSTEGNVYRREQPLPSFVSTRLVSETNQQADASPVQRIIGWGLAFPTGPTDWTIYVFHPHATGTDVSPDTPQVALPSGAINVTHLQGRDGCSWNVFQGRGDLAVWVQQFEAQFASDDIVTRTFDDQSASLKIRRSGRLTEIYLKRLTDNRLTGVIWSAPDKESR